MKHGATRNEQLQAGGRREQSPQQGRGLRQLLEVVEHDEGRLAREGIGERLLDRPAGGADAKRLGDRRSDKARIGEMREIDEHGPAVVLRGDRATDFHREPCLADPAGTGQGQQAGSSRPQ